ncbi:hypothetical protein AC625_00005 [Peribacillus loiseleuriae]|uniref:Uncharacterized protein n=1 Tax=Peribacillus loiseleuriae TaxID=1679170 RepID=A0A0K9GN71_9BACI|nr:hypothetical protein AC625_00005 [Peribacillus loiseleuriae]
MHPYPMSFATIITLSESPSSRGVKLTTKLLEKTYTLFKKRPATNSWSFELVSSVLPSSASEGQ